MKNLQQHCNSFKSMMNIAAVQSAKKLIIAVFCFSILLISTTSCSRQSASGCGTWPTMKSNHYRSDVWPIKIKSNNQFAQYKGYN
ncbi:MAG TPA: hypothetical protein PLR84_04795, partial [Chitinophagales bacterium]|nr:hypothetical protein [Chitinophagales bacterium]